MSRFTRVLALLAPSVPPSQQAQISAAMEGRDLQTPGPGVRGEAHPGSGQTTDAPTSLGGQVDGGAGVSQERPGSAQILLSWGEPS